MNDADCKLQRLARKVGIFGRISRKGAKTQSAAAFLRAFFAPLRLCAFAREKMFRTELSIAPLRETKGETL